MAPKYNAHWARSINGGYAQGAQVEISFEKEKNLGKGTGTEPKPTVKKQRIVEPAKMVKTSYIETLEEVNSFIKTLREELEEAIAKDERIKIR